MSEEPPIKQERERRGPSRQYSTDAITVHWEAEYCIHTARCIQGLPGVFDPARRPWIDIEGAAADDIAEVVQRCPTGALSFHRKDGGADEVLPSVTSVQPRTNGPLFVHGTVRVIDMEGNVVRETARAAMCRCGQSSNKPFCDGTHKAIGFVAD